MKVSLTRIHPPTVYTLPTRPNTAFENVRFGLALWLTLFVLMLLTGCEHRLEVGGAYAPAVTNVVEGVEVITPTQAADPALFAVDQTFDFLFTTVQGVLRLERNNRKLYQEISPAIKSTLDGIRPQAKLAVEEFAAARDAYLAHPTPEGLDLMDSIVNRLEQISAVAQAVIPDVAKAVKARK